MTKLTEDLHAGSALVSEEDNFHCREAIIVAESQTILANQVLGLGRPNTGAVTVGANAFTGTGNGTLTPASPAYGAGVQEGTYTSRLVEAGANLGQFEVTRPDGTVDGFATVGTAYDGQVKFTIADGSTDFSAAAQFTQAVTIADPADLAQYKVIDPAATDGVQHAAAVAIYPVTTGAAATAKISAWVRGPCQLRAIDLVWPGGITDPQKGTAITELAAVGIILR